jgi:hypothetical protein
MFMAEPNCLAGCIANYLCGTPDLPGPAGQQAESFAPWCWITFGTGTDKITVGNESYQGDPNTACVKSMEIGWTDTPSMKCEIVDEKGGTLQAVANSVRKCIKTRSGKGAFCEFQFGWILTTCSGGAKSSHVIPSKTFRLLITQLDVSYSEGKIKYTIEGTALDKVDEISRKDATVGSDSKPVKIEDAINSLCSQDPPCTVRYVELTPDGKLKDVKFNWVPSGTIEAVWQGDNMNRISVITKWLSPFRIKDGPCDKGVVIYFNPQKPDELIIMKDPSPGPDESRSCSREGASGEWGPLGTFIVNGGKCSSVIEFTPTMNILNAITSMAAGGGTSGPNKTASQLAEDRRCYNQNAQGVDAGTQLQGTITQQALDSYGTKTANDQAMKSEIAHHKASLVTAIQNPGVSAQLKILGNPDSRFLNWGANRYLSIVVINPYHIRGSGKCGDWLAYPVCNELFTNRLWMAKSINHSISTGSYTTTIEAVLASPVQISAGEPLGGTGGGGPNLENNCE